MHKKILNIFILSAIVVMGCGGDQAEGNKPDKNGDSEGDNSKLSAAIPVQVAAVKRSNISLSLMQTTTIEAIRQVDILTKVSGQVIKLPVEEGMRVKKGDLLAELNEAELKIEFMKTFKSRINTNCLNYLIIEICEIF